MTAPDHHDGPLPYGWPATAYIDGWISAHIVGHYYDRFHQAGEAYEPKTILEDMLRGFAAFADDDYVPHAVLVGFGHVDSGLASSELHSQILIISQHIRDSGTANILERYPDAQVTTVDALTTEQLRQTIEPSLARATSTTEAISCESIAVLAAEFRGLPDRASDTEGESRIYVRGLDNGFDLLIEASVRPLEVGISLDIKRGFYAVEGQDGTARLQAATHMIVDNLSNFELSEPLVPVSPEGWPLLTYDLH